MNIQCKRCGESFSILSSLKRHLDKSKICEAVITDTEPLVLLKELNKYKKSDSSNTDDKLYICKFCNTNFKHRSSKSRHEKNCKAGIEKNKKNKGNELEDASGVKLLSTLEILTNSVIGLSNVISKGGNMTINDNRVFNQTINLMNYNLINQYYTENKITGLSSWPTYSIDPLVINKFYLLNKIIDENRKIDLDNELPDSSYKLVLDICKPMFMCYNPCTINAFILDKNDNKLYCWIQERWVETNLDLACDTLYKYFGELVKILVKVNNEFSGLNNDNMKYAKLAIEIYNNDFLKCENKEDFKNTLIEYFYLSGQRIKNLCDNNLLQSEIDANKNLITMSINSETINKIRKYHNLPQIDINPDFNTTTDKRKKKNEKKFIITTNKGERLFDEIRNSISVNTTTILDNDNNKINIEIDSPEFLNAVINKKDNRNISVQELLNGSSDSESDDEEQDEIDVEMHDVNNENKNISGLSFIKTSYLGVPIWFNKDKEKGLLINSNSDKPMNWSILCKKVEESFGDTLQTIKNRYPNDREKLFSSNQVNNSCINVL